MFSQGILINSYLWEFHAILVIASEWRKSLLVLSKGWSGLSGRKSEKEEISKLPESRV